MTLLLKLVFNAVGQGPRIPDVAWYPPCVVKVIQGKKIKIKKNQWYKFLDDFHIQSNFD